MTLIDVKDGGLAYSEKHNVVFCVVDLIITNRESTPEAIQGLCLPEHKDIYIHDIKKRLV